jgi:hypothetical protein
MIVRILLTISTFCNQHSYQLRGPKVPAGWSSWRFWQHSNRGQVAGIPARVDLDFFAGTMEELIAYAGGDPNPPPPPDVEQRVRNLERWAGEIDTWARDRGYGGVPPTGAA